MTVDLEHLAMVGDGETVALISREGSIEWLCLPRFEFGRLLRRLARQP